MAITITEIKGRKKLKQFVQFAIDLYNGNEFYVPSLVSDEVAALDCEKNPAFEFCESVYYMAYRDGKPVGRIAGIINHSMNEKSNRKYGRFGFVDFIDDTAVCDALFNAVFDWLKSKGMTAVHGPLGFTDMDPEGILIEGFDQPGTMATIYNHPYYVTHIERLGFVKDVDWIEYKIFIPDAIPEKHQRISDVVQAKYKLNVLKLTSTKKLAREYGQKVFDLVNLTYKDLYGYSTLNQTQIGYYIKMYLPMLRIECVTLITNEKNELVGLGVAIPSMTKALQKSKGKLFPFGFIHLLKALKGKNNVVDLMLVGIHPDYQGKGVNALLFSDLIPIFIKNGYEYAESNPELEMNEKVQSQWQYFERVQHKRRRAFLRELS